MQAALSATRLRPCFVAKRQRPQPAHWAGRSGIARWL